MKIQRMKISVVTRKPGYKEGCALHRDLGTAPVTLTGLLCVRHSIIWDEEQDNVRVGFTR